jgi:glutamine amidotransferase
MRVAIFDYATGNFHSLAKAFERAGASVIIEKEAAAALRADALVLPGVGAFGAAAGHLAASAADLRAALAAGQPCLGVCLGMQLLFDTSEEGEGAGLGAIAGHVRKLAARRVPHIGWNRVYSEGDPLLSGLDPFVAYYANSFVAEPADPDAVIAWTDYENERFPAAVRKQSIWGVQFHPEKSGPAGLQLIRNFLTAVQT